MAGRRDVVEAVTRSVEGITKKQADEAVRAVFDSITHYLASDDSVQLPGFGRFSVSSRAAREGRNPATGDTIKIPASKSVKFKQGKELKDAVN